MTNYLYGDGVEVPDVPADIIMRRIELLDDNLTALLEVPLQDRDFVRIKDVLKAIKFWSTLSSS